MHPDHAEQGSGAAHAALSHVETVLTAPKVSTKISRAQYHGCIMDGTHKYGIRYTEAILLDILVLTTRITEGRCHYTGTLLADADTQVGLPSCRGEFHKARLSSVPYLGEQKSCGSTGNRTGDQIKISRR